MWSFAFIGVLHPDSGRGICDTEAVAVVAADRVIRVLLPSVLGRIGEAELARMLGSVPPMHDGDEVAAQSSVVERAASKMRRASAATRPLAGPVAGFSRAIQALARHREAPESVVFRAVAVLVRRLSQNPELDPLVEAFAIKVFEVLGPDAPRRPQACEARRGIVVRP